MNSTYAQYPIKSEESFSLNRSPTLFDLDELYDNALLSDYPFSLNEFSDLPCPGSSLFDEEIEDTPPQTPPSDMEISRFEEVSPVPQQLHVIQEQQQFLQRLQQQHYQYQCYLLSQQNLMLQYQLQQLNSVRPLSLQNNLPVSRPVINQTTIHFESLSSDDTKSPLDSYSCEVSKAYDEPLGYMNHNITNLNTSCFGNDVPTRCRTIPVDISGNLPDSQYNKIFKKYSKQLLLDAHPIFTQEDLENIKIHGRMYFLRNVKTIVPKVGPWKFNAHISHRRPDERQYNIPGAAITCKVKEWLGEDGSLWRLYHYKKGKVLKSATSVSH